MSELRLHLGAFWGTCIGIMVGGMLISVIFLGSIAHNVAKVEQRTHTASHAEAATVVCTPHRRVVACELLRELGVR